MKARERAESTVVETKYALKAWLNAWNVVIKLDIAKKIRQNVSDAGMHNFNIFAQLLCFEVGSRFTIFCENQTPFVLVSKSRGRNHSKMAGYVHTLMMRVGSAVWPPFEENWTKLTYAILSKHNSKMWRRQKPNQFRRWPTWALSVMRPWMA
jgi:hypothetical protein